MYGMARYARVDAAAWRASPRMWVRVWVLLRQANVTGFQPAQHASYALTVRPPPPTGP